MTGHGPRILILSTPKTGSTWLRSLLSGVYRLPQLYLEPGFDCNALRRAGNRWVAQYHIRPHPELSAWIRENGVTVVTTIRHPADVVISLYHHVMGFRARNVDLDFIRRMLSADYNRTDIVTDSTGQPFWADLACSLDWMSEAGTLVVRYEDLRCDPSGTLRALTSRICAVPDERIEAAIEMSELGLMRAMAGPFGGFFREGRIGRWRDLLPPDIIETFRSVAPYPAQMAALGYSMDPADPLIDRPIPSRPRHPMTTLERFENGLGAAPILRQCFFWCDAEQHAHWQRQLAATGPSSFYDWLNQPADRAGRGLYEELPLTNLAVFVYDQRPDARMVSPDLNGSDRYEYAQWFVRHAEAEYGLSREFIDSQRAGLARWANAPGRREGAGVYAGLPVCNLAAHLYDQRADLRLAYPDLTGCDRYELVQWFLDHGETDCDVARTCIESQQARLWNWASAASVHEGAGIYAGLLVCNLAAHLYEQRADLQSAYPDLTGCDRYEFVQWFLDHGEPDCDAPLKIAESQHAGLANWACATSSREGAGIYGGLPVGNLAAHLYEQRGDLQLAYPDLSGSDRYEYIRWFLDHGEAECGVPRTCVDAQQAGLSSWAHAPSVREGAGIYAGLPVCNLAAHLYEQRADLRLAYPDLSRGDRYLFVRWFVSHAENKSDVAQSSIESQQAGLSKWAHAPSIRHGAGIYGRLPMCNLAAHLYEQRTDLQSAYPDLTGGDRYAYVQWFVDHGETDCGVAQSYVDSQQAGLWNWACEPSMRHGAGIYAGLPVCNLAAHLYEHRADLQSVYPDLTGSDRYEFVQWFLRHGAGEESGFDPEIFTGAQADVLRWANATGIQGNATATNFAWHICRTRTDVPGSFPLIQGEERRLLVHSVIRAAKALGMDAEYIKPLERSLGRHWLPKRVKMRISPNYRLAESHFQLAWEHVADLAV